MTRCICSTAYLSFKKANSHHGRPCKLDLQQNSTISFYSSSPNRKKSIQHFLLSLSGYCPNSFWKQSSVHRFLRKQGRDAHCHCRRIYLPSCSEMCIRDRSKILLAVHHYADHPQFHDDLYLPLYHFDRDQSSVQHRDYNHLHSGLCHFSKNTL